VNLQEVLSLDSEEFEEPEISETESLEELTSSSLTSLQMDALYMHELFITFMSAGFSEQQALRLTSYFFMEGGVGISVSSDDDDDGIEWDDDED
jgi:hypothetical protein